MCRARNLTTAVCYRPGTDGPFGSRSGFWYGRCLSSLGLGAVCAGRRGARAGSLDLDEVVALAQACRGPYAELIYVLAMQGLR